MYSSRMKIAALWAFPLLFMMILELASSSASADYRGDIKCRNLNGVCKYNHITCHGRYVRGKCRGSASRQCCVPSTTGFHTTAARCTLTTYRSSYVRGFRNAAIRIAGDFAGSMNSIASAARSCHVTVYVTSSFRKKSRPVSGAIVVPASKSNHFVGHAIDMNLQTRDGWCNSSCLRGKRNTGARCFIEKVKKSGLRWGGDFRTTDPVHIDDGLNLKNSRAWTQLYKNLQLNC